MTQEPADRPKKTEAETERVGNHLAAQCKIRAEKFTDVVNLLHEAEKAFQAKDLDTGERFLQHCSDRLNCD